MYAFEVEAQVIGREHDAHDTDGTQCWCSPCIERYPDGDLVIHRDFDDGGH